MQSDKKMKALSVLSMAVVATMGVKAAHAATLTLYYDNIVDFDPTTDTVVQSYGYGSGNTNGTNYTGPTSINMAQGDILEFGVDAVVTNNINPDAGKLTGTITVNAGKTTKVQAVQPSFLGLATMSITVPSTDNSASILAPVTNGAPTGTFAGVPDYNSTVAINGANGYAVPTNSGGAAPGWTQNTLGDVSPTGPNGGDVGDHFAIFAGNGSLTSQNADGIGTISQFGAASATYSNATDFFDSLSYTALHSGVVVLSPTIHTAGTSYWTNTQRGSASVVSGYIAQEFNQPGDVIGTLPSLVINVISNVEPPPHAIILLAPASNGVPFFYGLSQGTLTVSGNNGSYNVAQVTGLSTPTGYVEANGFNPGTDEEIYALDVLVNGQQANPAQIGALVSAINNGDNEVLRSTGVTAADSYDGLPTVTGSSPFGSEYNLFLDSASGPSSDNLLAFDLSATDDTNFVGYSVSAVAVVPEPMSLGLLALGGLNLLAQRPRRQKINTEMR